MTSFLKLFNALGGIYSGEKNEYLKSRNRYQLLIIDDLGVKRDTPYVLEMVYLALMSVIKAEKHSLSQQTCHWRNCRIQQIWNMGAFMTVSWSDVFQLPFQAEITEQIKAGQTWRALQAF